jgi:hypothetical protein
MVDRKWPTCISLAMFGDEKSTRTFLFTDFGPWIPVVKIDCIVETKALVAMKIFINPFGCILKETEENRSEKREK